MRIKKDVLLRLIEATPASPVEVGGLLGGQNGVITQFVFDDSNQNYGKYIPNVSCLNRVLEQWREKDITFYGMFHSHFPTVDDLSGGDRRYISKIMSAVEAYVKELYFPIIIPRSHMKAYRAYIVNGETHIVCDKIETI